MPTEFSIFRPDAIWIPYSWRPTLNPHVSLYYDLEYRSTMNYEKPSDFMFARMLTFLFSKISHVGSYIQKLSEKEGFLGIIFLDTLLSWLKNFFVVL